VEAQKTLGKNIRALREAQGLSQEALARRSNVHPVQMGRIERGEHDLKVSTVVKVATGLDVAAGELWNGI
jgi:transcriptional regulator with XRE-family HTH domain